MSIAEAVRAAIVPKACKFGDILSGLSEDDAIAIRNGFQAGLTPTEASRILAKNGNPVSATVVKAHVANACCCQDAT
jgi:hypothetical protein